MELASKLPTLNSGLKPLSSKIDSASASWLRFRGTQAASSLADIASSLAASSIATKHNGNFEDVPLEIMRRH